MYNRKSYYTPTETEVLEILKKPDTSTIRGIRDKAMLELIYSSALRLSEVKNLDIEHIDLRDNTLRVRGKGNKERFIPMTKKACEALKLYLEKARPLYARRYPDTKALFLGEWGRRLTKWRIWEIVKEYASFNARITTHSLRHATATHMLKRGANIIYLQRLLGHAFPETTQIYTRLYPKDLIQIYKRFHPRERKS